MNSEDFGDSHQIGQRPGTHFLHDVPAVYLHGNFGNADFRCYLFVHESGGDQSQDVPLAGGLGSGKEPARSR